MDVAVGEIKDQNSMKAMCLVLSGIWSKDLSFYLSLRSLGEIVLRYQRKFQFYIPMEGAM